MRKVKIKAKYPKLTKKKLLVALDNILSAQLDLVDSLKRRQGALPAWKIAAAISSVTLWVRDEWKED